MQLQTSKPDGLNISALARELGISTVYLWQIINNQRKAKKYRPRVEAFLRHYKNAKEILR